jgi:dTDP-4-amino-4,6-dideoxygalactose transaminase
MKIQMVDLQSEFQKLESEMNEAIAEVFRESQFINGSHVKKFSEALKKYLDVKHVIPCGNGTDALQIAMMACEFDSDSEIIVPTHTYVATAEVIGLLKLKPVLVDVESDYFTLDLHQVKKLITGKTKAIVPVHLYGQCANMESLLELAEEHNLKIIEDAAQSFGAEYKFSDGTKKQSGTIGDIGITSFFPTKTLGGYGDGGAIFTNNDELGRKCHQIANHGQTQKYIHDVIGVNSRLDTIQAAFLSVKLKNVNNFIESRGNVADKYDELLGDIGQIQIPKRTPWSTHVFHQYTIQVFEEQRDSLREYLAGQGIPTVVYYPLPLHQQKAYKHWAGNREFPVADTLAKTVLSLPIHPEMTGEMINFVAEKIKTYFEG